MAGLSFEDLAADVAAGRIDTVVAAQVDMQGRLMGKRFHAPFFVETAWEETHGCNYLLAIDLEMEPVPGYATASWDRGFGDYVLKPDLSTLCRLPWLPGTAFVLCDTLGPDHAPVAVAPRTILRGQVARLGSHGLSAMTASELEFFAFRDSFEGAQRAGYRGLSPLSVYNEDYHIFQTTKEEGLMRAIRTGLAGAGIPVESTKGEASAGQAEVNMRYADALTMADRHVLAKNAVKEIAFGTGHAVTFLAKWDMKSAGSSCHIHQSLARMDGSAAFHDPAGPLGMSELMQAYLAGVLHHAPALTLLFAPYVNSYKRFVAGTFAPTRIVWSEDNRTAGFRLVGAGTRGVRFECRIGGADLNPYLAYAGLIAAGLDGIDRGLPLPPAFSGDAYATASLPEIPKTIRAATDAFAASAMLRAAFGDAVVDHYAHGARWEQAEYDRVVTDWDIARGFERA